MNPIYAAIQNGQQEKPQVTCDYFCRPLSANDLTSLRHFLTDTNGNKRLIPRQDQRGRHTPSNKKDRNIIIAHINTFNPLPSHYSRKHAPHCKYLPPNLTIKTMHADCCEKKIQIQKYAMKFIEVRSIISILVFTKLLLKNAAFVRKWISMILKKIRNERLNTSKRYLCKFCKNKSYNGLFVGY